MAMTGERVVGLVCIVTAGVLIGAALVTSDPVYAALGGVAAAGSVPVFVRGKARRAGSCGGSCACRRARTRDDETAALAVAATSASSN